MPRGKVSKILSDAEFGPLFEEIGAKELAKRMGVNERSVYARRRNIERKQGQALQAPSDVRLPFPGRLNLTIPDGQVVIASDLHLWPGAPSTVLRALKKITADIKPQALILNGDVCDFPKLSRFPQSWENTPFPQDELEAAQDHLADLAKCAGRARKLWLLGNHDERFERSIANAVPVMQRVKGVHLYDHFPLWERGWSCLINDGIEGGTTMVRHRPLVGGKNAPKGSVEKAGISFFHGHLHAQNVAAHSNYRPFDFYGCDTGCVADKEHKAFAYTEDGITDWRCGFAVATYRKGRLMRPELVSKWDADHVEFRGELHRV